MTASVILYGPHGCGKTTKAQEIARKMRLSTIIDDWWPGKPRPAEDALLLTNDCSVLSGDFGEYTTFDKVVADLGLKP